MRLSQADQFRDQSRLAKPSLSHKGLGGFLQSPIFDEGTIAIHIREIVSIL
jgi:hypothetical protein